MEMNLTKEKYKVAFIFACEGCDPQKDRSVIESQEMIMYTVGCASYKQAEDVARELVDQGCCLIDLCGAFGNDGVSRISKAVDGKVPIGAVRFDFHPLFRDKSGDDLFQKNYWGFEL